MTEFEHFEPLGEYQRNELYEHAKEALMRSVDLNKFRLKAAHVVAVSKRRKDIEQKPSLN